MSTDIPQLKDAIETLRATGDATAMIDLIPYSAVIGLACKVEDGQPVSVLPGKASNTGNTQIPAVHGGVVGAFLEHAAHVGLLHATDYDRIPKIINLSIDYLRPVLVKETLARATVVKQGRRIANVRVQAWQDSPDKPVAAAHAHFLIG